MIFSDIIQCCLYFNDILENYLCNILYGIDNGFSLFLDGVSCKFLYTYKVGRNSNSIRPLDIG